MKYLLENPAFVLIVEQLCNLSTATGDSFDNLADSTEEVYGVEVDCLGPHLFYVEITQPNLCSDRIAVVPAHVIPDDYCTIVQTARNMRLLYQTGTDRERFVADGFDDIDLSFDITEDSEVYYE